MTEHQFACIMVTSVLFAQPLPSRRVGDAGRELPDPALQPPRIITSPSDEYDFQGNFLCERLTRVGRILNLLPIQPARSTCPRASTRGRPRWLADCSKVTSCSIRWKTSSR